MATTHIKLRGGTAADWTAENPILRAREPGIETDTQKMKFGDGTTAWNSLPYAGGSSGPTVTGSDGQVAVCDGSGGAAGSAGLTFSGGTLSVGSSFVELAAIRAQSSSGMSGFIVETSGGVSSLKVSEAATGEPIVYMGDVNGANYIAADTRGYFDISASVLLQFGDPQGFGNGSVYAVDDPNQKTTQNVKHETSGDITITDSAKGLVLKDTSGTPHYWRISVSTLGVLTATDIGTSPP